MQRPWNSEWPGCNGERRYPLGVAATALDITGSFTLPDSFLLGLELDVSSGLDIDPTRFFLGGLVASPAGYVLRISYWNTDDTESPAASVAVPAVGLSEGASFELEPVAGTPFWDLAGRVTLGRVDGLETRPGSYRFAWNATHLDPDCVRPQLRGIAGLWVVAGSRRLGPFFGDIEIVAGSNFRVTTFTVDAVRRLRLDAIAGEGLSELCECSDEVELPPPIRSINLVPPRPDGSFDLLGSACLQVRPGTSALELHDICAQPCCGPRELDELRAEVRHLARESATLAGVINRLAGSVDQTNNVILGSRLGDPTCRSC